MLTAILTRLLWGRCCCRRSLGRSVLLACCLMTALSLTLLLHVVHLLHTDRALLHVSQRLYDPNPDTAADQSAEDSSSWVLMMRRRRSGGLTADGERSPLVRWDQTCVHPDLNPWDPSVMQFYQKEPLVDCSSAMEDWVNVTNGTFRISRQARRLYGKITCEYAPLVRGDDFSARHAPHVKPMADGRLLKTDFFKVACVSGSGKRYINIHSAVARNPAVWARLTSYHHDHLHESGDVAGRTGVFSDGSDDAGGTSGFHNHHHHHASGDTADETGVMSDDASDSADRAGVYDQPPNSLPLPHHQPPPPSPSLQREPSPLGGHHHHGVPQPTYSGLNLSVFMFGFDSLSRMAWIRLLPRTREFFLKELGGIELSGYNIVGDGTPAALLPILTGQMEEELPEARRGFPGAAPVDNHPWVWRNFSERGYVTAHAEDMSSVGTFQYRMLGFQEQPTDHNMRTFYLAAERMYKHNPPLCLGSRPRHVNFMNWFRDLFDMYRPFPKFFFGFHSEMSHDINYKVQALDDDFVAFLKDLEERGHLNSTLLVLMSDHGARYNYIRATAQGKLEERMPYFSFRFPPWFQKAHPEIVRNMEVNSQRLTTPFDIHATFLEVLNFTGAGMADINHRGLSLFKEVPKERTCSHAGITPHWCACLGWQPVNQSADDDAFQATRQAVQSAIGVINRYTESARNVCAELSLSEITHSARYVPNAEDLSVEQKLFTYRHSHRRVFFGTPPPSPPPSSTVELYQVSFQTLPGRGHFEVTCSRDVTSGSFSLSPKDISRINKYGTQPQCIQEKMPHLRPYCYCVDHVH